MYLFRHISVFFFCLACYWSGDCQVNPLLDSVAVWSKPLQAIDTLILESTPLQPVCCRLHATCKPLTLTGLSLARKYLHRCEIMPLVASGILHGTVLSVPCHFKLVAAWCFIFRLGKVDVVLSVRIWGPPAQGKKPNQPIQKKPMSKSRFWCFLGMWEALVRFFVFIFLSGKMHLVACDGKL